MIKLYADADNWEDDPGYVPELHTIEELEEYYDDDDLDRMEFFEVEVTTVRRVKMKYEKVRKTVVEQSLVPHEIRKK